MQKRFYLDTNIWIDYFKDRKSGLKQVGELARFFLVECKKQNAVILFSDTIEFELNNKFSEIITEIFENFGKIITKVTASISQYYKAKTTSEKKQLPVNDCLHAILAADNKAILITRDKHFLELQDIVEINFPEEINF